MPSYFRKIIPYAIPGALALLGCWWIYSHRKKQASSSDKQESVAAEEEQQQEAPEEDSPPKEEAGVPMREAVSEEEEHPENETSTSLPSAESTTPSLPCQTHERPDLSEDHPDLSVTTLQPSTVAEDTAKPEATGPPDESSGPACVSLPLTSECQGSAAVSLVEDSSSGANPDQCAAGGYAFALRIPISVGSRVSWVIFRVCCQGANRLVPFRHKVNSCLKLSVCLSSPVQWAVSGCRPGC